jgi:hypothetical protein
MTPGVLSRPHNDGSGRQNYYAQGVEHREHVTLMDGMMAANYWDMNVNRTGLSGETIADTNVSSEEWTRRRRWAMALSSTWRPRVAATRSPARPRIRDSHSPGTTTPRPNGKAFRGLPAKNQTGRLLVRRADHAESDLVLRRYPTALIDSTVDRSPLDIRAFQAFRPDANPMTCSTSCIRISRSAT